MVQPYIEGRQHTLTINLPKEPITLHADPVRLTQIFVNILNNAAKYTEPGGTITLTAELGGGHVHISVKDTGVGIPPERARNIFDPFGGAEGTARRPGGLRIGLSLAKRMAELHHGDIQVKSAGEGKGSEFIVRLPLPPTSPLPLEAVERRSRARFRLQKTTTAGTRILVVDDNEAAAQSLGTLLRHNGHTVALAYSGAEALEKAAEFKPEAVLLDIGLPDQTGYEVAQEMQRRRQEARLIALTGYGQQEDRQKAHAAGFAEHLVKPVSITDVERVLTELGVYH